MRIQDLENNKLKPLKDLIAFVWVKPKSISGFLIPETFYDWGLRPGRHYLGKVVTKGPRVKGLKKGDMFLFQEYGMINPEPPKEDNVYFIHEKEIPCVVSEVENMQLDYRAPLSKSDIAELEGSGELEAGSKFLGT